MTENPSGVDATHRRKQTHPVLLLLAALLVAGAFAAGYYVALVRHPLAENEQMNAETVAKTIGLNPAGQQHLDPMYHDANGDLLADPPPADQCIDPEKLTFSYVTEEPASFGHVFSDLLAAISKATGKPVEYVAYKSPAEQLNAIRDGQLHIAGLNTGLVPVAVNNCGFIPFCALATADGTKSYKMEIIVPAGSEIQSVEDLRGHEIVLTDPASNSGFKAPLAVLVDDYNMRPVIDFRIRYSGSHEASIDGIARGDYQAAAVASDVLARAVAAGAIRKQAYRSIYQSAAFPTAGFGYAYNLKPELAEKIKQTMLDFQWKGTSLAKQFGPSGESRFAPVDYKKDWAPVRHVDEEIHGVQNLRELMDQVRHAATAPAESAAAAPAASQPAEH